MAGFTAFHRLRTGLVVGLIVALFASALVNLRPSQVAAEDEVAEGLSAMLERLELKAFDLRMRYEASRMPSQAPIVMVNVDDETILGAVSRAHPWPWKRSVLTKLVGELHRLGARSVVIDPVFTRNRASFDEELEFARAIGQWPEVVLGVGFEELSPEMSAPEGRFAFVLGRYPDRKLAMKAAGELRAAPGVSLFILESEGGDASGAGGVALWQGGYLAREDAVRAATGAVGKEGAASVRELSAREMFHQVTRDKMLAEAAALDQDDVPELPENFRSLQMISGALLSSGAGIGVFDMDVDMDGSVRSVPPAVRYGGRIYPSVALQVIRRLDPAVKVRVGGRHVYVGDNVLELNDVGRMGLRFYGGSGAVNHGMPFAEISAASILRSADRQAEGRLTDKSVQEAVRDKAVFLSPTADMLHAEVGTPVGPRTRAFVWGMAAEAMLRGGDIVRAPVGFDGWLAFAMAILGGVVTSLLLRILRRYVTWLNNLFAFLAVMAGFSFYQRDALAHGQWVGVVAPVAAYVLSSLLASGLVAADGMKAVGRVWDALGRTLPLKITEQLVASPRLLNLAGESRPVTVMTFDMLHFSQRSADLVPTALAKAMREVWTGVSDEICHSGGRLDHIVGDSVMAYWGAPMANRRQTYDACRCALGVKALCDRQRKRWKNKLGMEVDGAIAIAAGDAVVGDFGCGGVQPRTNYTIMGTPLGQARRLLAMSARWNGRILMTDQAARAVSGMVESRCLGIGRVGPSDEDLPAPIHELLALKGGLPRAVRQRVAKYNEAFVLASKRDFAGAVALLEAVVKEDASDTPSQVLLTRCRQCIDNPPADNWQGFFEVR